MKRKEFLSNFDFTSYVYKKFLQTYSTSNEDRIRVDCPFCEDTKGHLYILLSAGLPYCQKCKYDSKSPVKFIAELEGLSINEVLSMAEDGAFVSDPGLDVDDIIDEIFEEEDELEFSYTCLSFGSEFVPVLESTDIPSVDNMLRASRRYLNMRGLSDETIQDFDIRFCYQGQYSGRIIVPCYYKNSLVTFVARDLFGNSDRKYLNPTGNKQSDFLFNIDSIIEDYVVVTEGVFDAISVSEVVPSVASFGKSLSKRQISMLNEFKKVIFYWDLDAYPQVEQYCKKIQSECFVVLHSDGKDAGERISEENLKLLSASVSINSVAYQMFKLENFT